MIGWRPVSLLVVAAVLLFLAFMDVGNAAACGDAQALTDTNRFADARTAFVKLLDDDATKKCAKNGLATVAQRQCERAKALDALGRKKESEEEFTALATSEPVQAAQNCREALESPPGATCEDAAKIDERAYPEKAWKAYVALLDESGQEACATAALTRIGEARCKAASALLDGSQDKAAQKELLSLATTEPLLARVTDCAVEALKG
jgi:hypothetical protein